MGIDMPADGCFFLDTHYEYLDVESVFEESEGLYTAWRGSRKFISYLSDVLFLALLALLEKYLTTVSS